MPDDWWDEPGPAALTPGGEEAWAAMSMGNEELLSAFTEVACDTEGRRHKVLKAEIDRRGLTP